MSDDLNKHVLFGDVELGSYPDETIEEFVLRKIKGVEEFTGKKLSYVEFQYMWELAEYMFGPLNEHEQVH